MEPRLDSRVAVVRRFNRFFTQQIGVLHEGLLHSPYSLTEVRVLYELGGREPITAAELGAELSLDRGYLSRILSSFQRRRLVGKQRSKADARRSFVRLTRTGRGVLAALDERATAEVRGWLGALGDGEQRRLVDAMQAIETVLGEPPGDGDGYRVRTHRPGDLGWIVERHGAVYAAEHGYGIAFEALVARIAADFLERFDPRRERCWLAEVDGERVGSVMLVRETDDRARLRLLLVEPRARGMGIGGRLVDECVGFARRCGYRTVILSTDGVLHAAHRIYVRAGFQLASEAPNPILGDGHIEQTWELALAV